MSYNIAYRLAGFLMAVWGLVLLLGGPTVSIYWNVVGGLEMVYDASMEIPVNWTGVTVGVLLAVLGVFTAGFSFVVGIVLTLLGYQLMNTAAK